jgi:hypothetical protein
MLDFLFECLVIGDSIATGVSLVKPECKAVVKSGITTEKWIENYKFNPLYRETLYKVAVISLGTNDYAYHNIEENLLRVRNGVRARMVIWILPNYILKPEQREIIIKLATQYGDKTMDIHSYVGPDGIHPNGLDKYKEIADRIFLK